MATLPTITELRSMQMKDLLSESGEQSRVLTKLRLDVRLGSQKDTSKLRRLRTHIAQIQTVLVEKRREGGESELKKQKKASRVPAQANS